LGDRTTCTLSIGGILVKTDIDTLAQALTDAYCEDSDPKETLLSGNNEFIFEEVNYAAEDDDLTATLKAMGLSYTWANNAGAEYCEGITCYNAATDETYDFTTSNGDIVVTTTVARDPAKMANVLRWERFHNRLKLTILSTGHEVMAHTANKQVENFLDAIDSSPESQAETQAETQTETQTETKTETKTESA